MLDSEVDPWGCGQLRRHLHRMWYGGCSQAQASSQQGQTADISASGRLKAQDAAHQNDKKSAAVARVPRDSLRAHLRSQPSFKGPEPAAGGEIFRVMAMPEGRLAAVTAGSAGAATGFRMPVCSIPGAAAAVSSNHHLHAAMLHSSHAVSTAALLSPRCEQRRTMLEQQQRPVAWPGRTVAPVRNCQSPPRSHRASQASPHRHAAVMLHTPLKPQRTASAAVLPSVRPQLAESQSSRLLCKTLVATQMMHHSPSGSHSRSPVACR